LPLNLEKPQFPHHGHYHSFYLSYHKT
jgi:hypothetical protein